MGCIRVLVIMHKSVLLDRVLEIFNPQPGEIYIDATINGGGHAMEIAKLVGADGKVLGIDWDFELIKKLEAESKKSEIKNITLVCDNYANLQSIIRKYNLDKISGIIFDLGFSSYHIETAQRGFSFLRDEPLDMRYNTHGNSIRAEEIINTWPRKTIETAIRDYGEERYAGRIADAICQARRSKKIYTTRELVEIIRQALFRRYKTRERIHFATRTFQALRIVVNEELLNLERVLPQAVEILIKGGKLIVISFHSLEDRMVKKFFKEMKGYGTMRILTPKTIRPTPEEIRQNPRARSAKLRAAEKN